MNVDLPFASIAILYIKNIVQKNKVRQYQSIKCIKSQICTYGEEIKVLQSNVAGIEINRSQTIWISLQKKVVD